MIEIEKKFLLTAAEQQALLEGATLLSEKMVEDSYFDTRDYYWTKQNFWLRRRDGEYELKAPLKHQAISGIVTNQYHEITDPTLIAKRLELPHSQDFETALSLAGITEFVTSLTDRKSYAAEDFHIDLDKVTFRDSDFVYNLAEIELLVDSEAEAGAAEQRIIEFAKSRHLATNQIVYGKIIAFLEAERPEHYTALQDAGVI